MTTRRIYSVDVPVYATAYIIADSLEDAQKIARGLAGTGIDCEDREQVNGLMFDDPDLAEVTFSPAMTISSDPGVENKLAADIELREEAEVAEEEEADEE